MPYFKILKMNILSLLIILLLTLTGSAQPPGIILRSEFIYPREMVTFPSCHASTIEETPQGLVAAWFGGTHERHQDVCIWLSRMVDGKWTGPAEHFAPHGSRSSARRVLYTFRPQRGGAVVAPPVAAA